MNARISVVKDALVPRVLVVDDDPMVSMAIEVCLQRQGMEGTIADGGEDGMRELASGSHDVMIADIFMQCIPGFKSIERGAPCCLRKPLTSKALLAAVDDCR